MRRATHLHHQPDRVGSRDDALAPGDALDAALADLHQAEVQALRWQVRRADGLDAAAEAEFQAWLAADPAHQTAIDDMADVWQVVDELPADGVARLRTAAAASDSSTDSMDASRALPRSSPRFRNRLRWPGRHARFWAFGRWAPHALAAGVAFAVSGGGWLAWDTWQLKPVFSQHYATARGQQLEARLPDGSTLRLDTSSQADVALYRQRREVRLPEGQIMFTVQGDKARPFDVLAGGMRITVVGTRFSVRYTPSLGGNQVKVAVEEGRVRVARAAAARQEGDLFSSVPVDDAVVLEAGQTVATDGEGRLGAVGQVAAGGVAPWRGNRVNFDNTPLAVVVAELERYANTGLLVRDPAVASMRVTGSVDLRRVEDFTRSLPLVLPVRLQPNGKATEVVSGQP